MAGIERSKFGTLPDGRQIDMIRLENSAGTSASVMTYGATLISFRLGLAGGQIHELTLGRDTLDDYLAGHPFFGSTVGRVANRIRDGRFELDGKAFELARNKDGYTLHGGFEGLDKKVWEAFPHSDGGAFSVILTCSSPDGDQGFPGNLDVRLVVSLGEDNCLSLEYEAVSDAKTPVNLTNHTYWNLDGTPDVGGHRIVIEADRYVPVDESLLPIGELATVENTRFDLREETVLRETFGAGGFDHSFGFSCEPGRARIWSPESGVSMKLETSKPAVQFYTGNFLEGVVGRGGSAYGKHAGFCLETQYHPDSVNNPNFGRIFLEPGETYRHWSRYRFEGV